MILGKLDKLDLGIVLGASGPNYLQLFKEQKGFVKEMLDRLDVGASALLPGIVLNGKIPAVAVSVGDILTVEKAKKEIENLKNPGARNNLYNALLMVKNELFNAENGARTGVPKSILLFIDKDIKYDKNVIAALRNFKTNGVRLIVVTQGENIDKDKIKDITPDVDDWFFIKDQDDSKNLVKHVADAILSGNNLIFRNRHLLWF